MWAVLGTALCLIGFYLIILASTDIGRQETSNQPAMNLPWDHMLLQKQPYKFAEERQIHSRQITAAWSPCTSQTPGKMESEVEHRMKNIPISQAGFTALQSKEGRQCDKIKIALG